MNPADEAAVAGGRAPLAKGDRIFGRPCLVTIEQVTDTAAYGHCETCDDRHIIDRFRYEAGDGPWRPIRLTEGDAP